MGAKAIIARSTCETRIPIRKRSASKEKKGYLKKPGLINIIDSIKAGGGVVGSLHTCNDENRSFAKSKLIRRSIAKNVTVTPHKTRTGKVYSRLSNVFAHKLPRLSQQLPPPIPTSNKCFNEPHIVKPLKESSSENVIKLAESVPVVSDAVVTTSADIFTLVSEEEINRSIINVPNLDDIQQPKALISFNSTINESLVYTIDTETDKTEEPSALVTLPKLPDIDFTSSTPRKDETPSVESSPLIPRMDPVKIYEQFKGFTPLVFEQPSASSSKELVEPERLKEKPCVEDMCSFEETEKEDADEETPKESPELHISPVQLPDIPEVTSEMPSTTTDFDPSSVDVNDKKSYSNGRRSRRFNLDEVNSKTENITSSENRCPSLNITRRKQKVDKSTKQKDTVLLNQPTEMKSNRSRRNSIFPRQAIKTIEEKGGFDSDLYQTSSSSSPNSLDDSVICLSPVRSSSSSVSSSSLHGQQTTDPPTHYEPPPKKNRGRTNKKSPLKKSPQKLPPAEGDESQTASNGVELIDGKVYAIIKKAGKKGIPLKVEVDSSLLVEPKESCLKKPKNESWNGEKRFRWADWTKDKELTDIREFESDEKYSFRKSTKEKRFVDPYGD